MAQSCAGSSRLSRWVPRALAMLVVVLLVAWAAALIFGQTVRRIYFSPDKFVYKRSDYRVSRFRHVPLWFPRVSEYETPMLRYLHEERYVSHDESADTRWDLARKAHPAFKRPVRRPADRLHQILSSHSEETLEWSQKYPDRARILWPMFVELVRQQEYNAAARFASWAMGPGLRFPLDEYGKELEEWKKAWKGEWAEIGAE